MRTSTLPDSQVADRKREGAGVNSVFYGKAPVWKTAKRNEWKVYVNFICKLGTTTANMLERPQKDKRRCTSFGGVWLACETGGS